MFSDRLEHCACFSVLKTRPTQLIVGLFLRVFTRRKNAPLDRAFEARSLQFLDLLQLIKTAQKKQVGDLLDYFERIRNAARPKGIPNCFDLTPDFTGEHVRFPDALNGPQINLVLDPRQNILLVSEIRSLAQNYTHGLSRWVHYFFGSHHRLELSDLDAPYTLVPGRGNGAKHSGGPDSRDSKGLRPKPRDIYVPDLHIDRLKVKREIFDKQRARFVH